MKVSVEWQDHFRAILVSCRIRMWFHTQILHNTLNLRWSLREICSVTCNKLRSSDNTFVIRTQNEWHKIRTLNQIPINRFGLTLETGSDENFFFLLLADSLHSHDYKSFVNIPCEISVNVNEAALFPFTISHALSFSCSCARNICWLLLILYRLVCLCIFFILGSDLYLRRNGGQFYLLISYH